MTQEVVRGFCEGYYGELITNAVPLRDGQATFDELGPGLGAALRPQVLNRPDVVRRVSAH